MLGKGGKIKMMLGREIREGTEVMLGKRKMREQKGGGCWKRKK